MTPRFPRSLMLISVVLFAAAFALAQDARQLPANHLLLHAHPRYLAPAPRGHSAPGLAHAIPGIDSLTNWNGSYHTFGFDHSGNPRKTWYYNMVGNKPERGGTTTIHAPVVPVALDLLNPDGSIFLHYDPQPFILPALQSPLFQNSTFTSSPTPTQVTDAVQRAEFFNTMAPDWHTMLYASLKQERIMKVPADSYFYSLKNNGKCCRFVLIDINAFFNLLFPVDPADTVTPIGAAENAGDITTQDISTFLFPNTYLYFGTPDQC
jgi:hypothetical protein